jgi:hypothetical protein
MEECVEQALYFNLLVLPDFNETPMDLISIGEGALKLLPLNAWEERSWAAITLPDVISPVLESSSPPHHHLSSATALVVDRAVSSNRTMQQRRKNQPVPNEMKTPEYLAYRKINTERARVSRQEAKARLIHNTIEATNAPPPRHRLSATAALVKAGAVNTNRATQQRRKKQPVPDEKKTPEYLAYRKINTERARVSRLKAKARLIYNTIKATG